MFLKLQVSNEPQEINYEIRMLKTGVNLDDF